jgi:hypothetical protein
MVNFSRLRNDTKSHWTSFHKKPAEPEIATGAVPAFAIRRTSSKQQNFASEARQVLQHITRYWPNRRQNMHKQAKTYE